MQIKTSVFISYSRDDATEAAEDIRQKLIAASIDTFLDTHSIVPGEPWEDRLSKLVSQSEKVLYLISPNSVASKHCTWEIRHAEELGKSIIPVVVQDVDFKLIPDAAKRLNFLFMRSPEERSAQFVTLSNAISIDIAWEREKKRIGDLASAWEAEQRPNRLLLTSEDAIKVAEIWRDTQPKSAPPPTKLQLALIAESREKRTRRQRSLLVGSFMVALVMASTALFAWLQRDEAVTQRAEAERRQLIAIRNESAALTTLASKAVDEQRPATAAKLALAAWPRNATDQRPAFQRTHQLLSRIAPMQREMRSSHRFMHSIAHAYFIQNTSRVLTFSDDGEGQLHDGLSGAFIADVEGDADRVKFSPNRTVFATILQDNQTVGIWDAKTGQAIAKLPHDKPVFTLRLNYDGSRVLTATGEQFARLWDTKTESVIRDLKRHALIPAHEDSVIGVRFTPTGARAITVSHTSVYLWDGISGDLVGKLKDSANVEFAHSDPDGKTLLTTQLDGSSAMLFDVMSGKRYGTFNNPVEDAIYVPDQNRLIIWRSGEVLLFDTETNTVVSRVAGERRPYTGSTWNPDRPSRVVSSDGKRFLTWTEDRRVQVLSVTTGDILATTFKHDRSVLRADFAANDNHFWVQTSDNDVHLWDSTFGIRRAIFSAPPSATSLGGISVSEDGKSLLIWYEDASLKTWNIATRTPQTSIVTNSAVRSASLNAKKDQIILGVGDQVLIHFLETGEKRSSLKTIEGYVEEAKFNSDGTRILVTEYQSPHALLWNTSNFKSVANLGGAEFRVEGAKFNPEHPVIFAWTSNHKGARFLSSETGDILKSIEGGIRDAVFNSQGTRLLVMSYSNRSTLYNAVNGEEIASLPGSAMAAEFNADGSKLVVVRWGLRAGALEYLPKVFDAESGKEIATFEGHTSPLRGGRFTADGTQVLTWTAAGEMRLWDASDGSEIRSFPGHKKSIKGALFSPNKESVLSWSGDGTVRLWDIKTGNEIGIVLESSGPSGSGFPIAFSEDGRHIYVKADGRISVVEAASLLTLAEFKTGTSTWGMIAGGVDDRLVTWSAYTADIWRTELKQFKPAFGQICSDLSDKSLDGLTSDLGLNVVDPICFHSENIPLRPGT